MNSSIRGWSDRLALGLAFAMLACFQVPLATGETADAAIRQAFEAISANRPDALFALLPASYRRDIDKVVQGYAGKMDPDIWNRGRAMALRAATILGTKGNLIAPEIGKQFGDEVNPEDLKNGITAASSVIAKISGGPLTDLQRLRQGNVQALLANEGRALMQSLEQMAALAPREDKQALDDPWSMVRRARVRLVDADGDRATVAIDGVEDAEDFDLVRVEDAWVPAEMAEKWAEGVAGALETIENIDYTSPEGQARKTQTLMVMGVLDGVLGQIERAETAKDLEASIMGIKMLLMMGGMGGEMPMMGH